MKLFQAFCRPLAAGSFALSFFSLCALLALVALPVQLAAATTTSTVLQTSGTSVATGTAITLTATVTAANKPVTPGTVVFCDATAVHCEDIHILGSAQLNATGKGTIKIVPSIGTHAVQAVFRGTTGFATSKSAIVNLTVKGPYPTVTTIAQTGSPASYTLTGTVTVLAGPTAPSGYLSFVNKTNGNALIGTAPLGAAVPSAGFAAPESTSTAAGVFPGRGIAADFNNDGITDIAELQQILLGNGDGTFTVAASAPVGEQPQEMTAGDFNGDGRMDLAVMAFSSGQLTILLGNGDGTFTPAASQPAPIDAKSVPSHLFAADMNNDGRIDLVVVTQASRAHVLLGNGDGTFGPPNTLALPELASFAVGLGDFNGDGILDIAAASNETGPIVSVFLGKGDGSFGTAAITSQQPAGLLPEWMSVADFNQDGIPDIVVSEGNAAEVSLSLGNGNGTFGAPQVIPTSSASNPGVSMTAVGDLNGDGFADLAAVNSYTGATTVLLGNGDGTFTAAAGAEPASQSSAVAGAFTRDGMTSLAFPLVGQLNLYEYRESTVATAVLDDVTVSGSAAQAVFTSYPGTTSDAASASGTINLVGATGVATTTTLRVSPVGSAMPAQAVQLTATISPSVSGSFMASGTVTFFDGTTQIGTASVASGQATLSITTLGAGQHTLSASYAGDANFYGSNSPSVMLDVTTQATTTTLTIAPASTVALGSAVTLSASVKNGSVSVINGVVRFCDTAVNTYCEDGAIIGTAQITSAGNASLHWIPSAGVHSVQAFFGLQSKLANSGSSATTLTVTGVNPTTPTIALSGGPGSYTLTSTLTGFGGTGRTGTLTFQNGVDHVYTTLATFPVAGAAATLGFTRPALPATGGTPSAIASGDFNNDGIADFAVANTTSKTLTILLGRGDGTFTTMAAAPATGNGPAAIAAGDFNQDGKLDLVVANSTDNTVSILLGNGDGTFTGGGTALATGQSPVGIAVGDFNGDGQLDLAVVCQYVSGVAILLGNGSGGFTAGANADTLAIAATGVIAADFNGDGIADLSITASRCGASSPCLKSILLLGKGDGTFTTVNTGDRETPQISQVVGDFNRDGRPDIAYTQAGSDLVFMELGNGDGTFAAGPSLTTAFTAGTLVSGDFNHDGSLDIAVVGPTSQRDIQVFPGLGDGTFGTGQMQGTGYGPVAIVAADINHDGSPDLAVVNQGITGHPGNNLTLMVSEVTDSFTLSPVSFAGGMTHNLRAAYSGDADYGASTTAPIAVPGTGAAITVTDTVTPTTLTVGQTLQCAASVAAASPGGPAVTGTVSFYVNGGTLLGTVTLSSGHASFSTTKLAAGSYSVTADYNGDANYLAANSAATKITVNPAP